MKTISKILVAASFLAIFSSKNVQAQFSIGLRTGVNFANFNIDSNNPDYDGESYNTKIGSNTAFLINFQLRDTPLSIQMEPGYSQRGLTQSSDEMDTYNGVTTRYVDKITIYANYIEMPVLLRFTPKLGNIEGIISVGPELRYLTSPMKFKSESTTYEDGAITEKSSETENMEWDENQDPGKTDIGLVGGLGIAVPFGKLKLFAEGRYHHGFAFINSSSTTFGSGVSTSTYEKISNRGLSVSVGLLLRLGE